MKMKNRAPQGGAADMEDQKHHYIPCLYLKQWVGHNGQLCEFTRPYNVVKPRRTHPHGTGYTRGLYAFPRLPPRIANELEDYFLKQVDGQADTALQVMLGNRPDLNLETRSAWSRFIIALLHRNPEAIQRITDEVERKLPRMFDPLRENGPSTDQRTSHAILSVLQTIMDSKIVGPVLNGMIWRVLVIDRSRYPLLTSDRPIIMTNGIAQPEGHIVMPISPNQIFVAVNSEEMFARLDASIKNGRITEAVNDQVVKQARRFVWGTDDRQLCFVEKRLGQRITCTPWE
jgi:hypothetical protein